MKFYYLHTMELSEAASGDTKLVLESDYNAKLAEKDAEIMRLEEKLLNFEGQTFSENQRIAEQNAELKALRKDNINLEHGLKFEASIRESIQQRLKNQIDNFRELETQNKKLIEALKLANDILNKNSIYCGDLADFDKLLNELEIK